MYTKGQRVFFIGDWRVSPMEGVLSRNGEVVRLEPKVMEVLVYLTEHPGQVVTREELDRAVWRGALVGYDAVTRTVIKLRRALGDNARQPRFVSTIPKRGYALIAPVTFADDALPSPPSGTPAAAPDVISRVSRRRDTRVGHPPHMALLGTLFLAALVLWIWEGRPPPHAKNNIAVPSIMVLPFKNLSHDPAQDYLADGMTVDLIAALSRTPTLRVIGSNTSFTYKGRPVSPDAANSNLHVDFILHGSMRKHGDAIRVNAELVNAKTGFNKWAGTYDRRQAHLFMLERELTMAVMRTLAVHLTIREKQWMTHPAITDLDAYHLFQEGRRLSRTGTRESNRLARTAFREAIETDPAYGRAYAALARALGVGFQAGWTDDPMETLNRALELARRGVALDDSVPQTHWALGFIQLLRRNYGQARKAAAATIRTGPGCVDGYSLLALIDNNRGKATEAIRVINRGMRLNTYYTWMYPYNLGRAYYTLGRYSRAIAALEHAHDRNPNAVPVKLFLAASYQRAGRHSDAEWLIQEIRVLSPTLSTAHLGKALPIEDVASRNAFLADLRKAGLPQ